RGYRTVKAGPEIAAQPMWPSLGNIGNANGLVSTLGAERAGTRRESYVLQLQAGGKNWTCNVPENVWIKYAQGATAPLQIRTVGGADCSSLK
ncbi:MAG: hypothetical protein ABIZ09_12420, partial [Rhodoferax sp.]